jgi:hypothetical protein
VGLLALSALALPANAAAARIEITEASPRLEAGRPAHMRIRLSFTGERSCRLTFSHGTKERSTLDTLTDVRFVTWRWVVPRDARSGRWTLEAACGAEAEQTVRIARRMRVVGVPGGRPVAAAHVRVFTSGDPLILAFLNRP